MELNKKRIGIIVNPFAGAGGRLGWKGTDWPLPLKILEMKVPLIAPTRAREFLKKLGGLTREPIIIAPPGWMGWKSLKEWEGPSEIIECIDPRKWPTTPHDTHRCASEMINHSIDILVFVGGDGTARVIYDAIDKKIPVLGVPAGVKVYSAVFAYTPREAALVVYRFLRGEAELVDREVLDIDEEAFRQGILNIRMYGYLKVPRAQGLVSSGKTVAHGISEDEEIDEIAEYFAEELWQECTLFVMGPGRTVKKIAERIGVQDKTLLGVDLVHGRRIVAKDVDEETLYEKLKGYKGRIAIVVSPIGGQGFIFGRGNQQISPKIIKLVGKENIIVVATPSKLSKLKSLRVDTGDKSVDDLLRGYIRVLVGYGKFRVIRVE